MFVDKPLSTLAIITFLAGCNATDPGQQYVGKWEETKQHIITVKIRPNNSAYLVDITSPGPFSNKVSTHTYPGSLKDGFLHVALDGIDDATFAVDSGTGHLTGAGFEFAKAQ